MQQQDERALDYLIQQYGGLIKAVVSRHLAQFPHLQEECLNDIFLAVWLHAKDYDPSKNTFKNWLCALSRYKCIDYKRRWGKDLLSQELETAPLPMSDSAETQALQQQLSEETESLLATLSPTDRSYFEEYYLQDHTVKEIAQKAQVKESVIYNHLSRSRSKLRQRNRKQHRKGENVYEKSLSNVK